MQTMQWRRSQRFLSHTSFDRHLDVLVFLGMDDGSETGRNRSARRRSQKDIYILSSSGISRIQNDHSMAGQLFSPISRNESGLFRRRRVYRHSMRAGNACSNRAHRVCNNLDVCPHAPLVRDSLRAFLEIYWQSVRASQ